MALNLHGSFTSVKPSLQFRLQQQLALTPQLQQAIKLLQLSSQELEAELIEALESNPLLERGEFSETLQAETADKNREVTGDSASTADVDVTPDDDLWDSHYERGQTAAVSSGPGLPDGGDRELAEQASESLADHLRWQLQMNFSEPLDLAIGAAIIDAIDDHGYLIDSAEQIQQTLGDSQVNHLDKINSMIVLIQQFDPIGVATADMRHCLLIQLGLMQNHSPTREIAMTLVSDHLEDVARQEFVKLAKLLNCSDQAISDAVELVRSLEPRPGAQFSSNKTEYIRADVVVERSKTGQWRARLHDEHMPRLQISDFYTKLLDQTKGSDADYLRTHMNEARWLLRSLETRNDTIFRVANAIVKHQQGFLEYGPEQMKPLVLREIAEAVELHESTISRVTTRKYMLTPRGVFEFKYFFSSHVGTADGGEASATAVQAMIKKLIDEEPLNKPLSDAKITALLSDNGIELARRTVAKYREAMNIESSSKRRRLS